MNTQNVIDQANKVAAEAEELIASGAATLKIVETDTIKANYAQLPITELAIGFLVQVLEPVAMVPKIVKITHSLTLIRGSATDTLKDVLLDEWKAMVASEGDGKLPGWMHKVDKVNLVECDLLVPREKA